MRAQLTPLPLHQAHVEELQRLEPELWRWFASGEASAKHEDEVRHELLKSTYRLDRDAHADVHGAADRAKEALGLDAEVTLYQAQGESQLNAMVLMLGGQPHVILSGPTQTLLSPDELLAVVAHELAHFALWRLDGGVYFVAERMLTAFANDPRAHAAHLHSDRRFALATEILADRGGLAATGDLGIAVAALVKMTTGLASVDARSYLRQADEVFARGPVVTEGVTHPEPFIRARALRLWSEQAPGADAEVTAMIEGPLHLEELDLRQQAEVAELTRRLLAAFLEPEWLQTEETRAHARLFFADVRPDGSQREPVVADWRALLARSRPSLADYVCYVLLDVVVADNDVEEVALAAAFRWSDELGIGGAFDAVVARELGLTKAQVAKRRGAASELLEHASA